MIQTTVENGQMSVRLIDPLPDPLAEKIERQRRLCNELWHEAEEASKGHGVNGLPVQARVALARYYTASIELSRLLDRAK